MPRQIEYLDTSFLEQDLKDLNQEEFNLAIKAFVKIQKKTINVLMLDTSRSHIRKLFLKHKSFKGNEALDERSFLYRLINIFSFELFAFSETKTEQTEGLDSIIKGVEKLINSTERCNPPIMNLFGQSSFYFEQFHQNSGGADEKYLELAYEMGTIKDVLSKYLLHLSEMKKIVQCQHSDNTRVENKKYSYFVRNVAVRFRGLMNANSPAAIQYFLQEIHLNEDGHCIDDLKKFVEKAIKNA